MENVTSGGSRGRGFQGVWGCTGVVRGGVRRDLVHKKSSKPRDYHPRSVYKKTGTETRTNFAWKLPSNIQKRCFAYTKPLFSQVPPSLRKSRNWRQRLDFWVPFVMKMQMLGGLGGVKMAARWRHSGGTVAAQWRHSGGTVASRWRHQSITKISPEMAPKLGN